MGLKGWKGLALVYVLVWARILIHADAHGNVYALLVLFFFYHRS